MIELLYFIPIILVFYGFGSFVLKRFKFNFHSSLEDFVFSVSIGMFFFSYLTMAFGFLGLLYKWLFFLIFILGLIIFSKQILNLISNLIYTTKNIKIKFNFSTFLFLVLCIFIISNLIATMVPPWEIDTILYHTTLPKIYSMNHEIIYTPSMLNSYWPLFTEMLYLVGIILKNGILAKLFAWFFGVLLVFGIYSFSKRFFSKKIGLIAAVIFYTTPHIMQRNTTGLVDISLGFFIFVACYSFLIWFFSQRISWLILSAIFAGVSASVKINGSFPMVILALGIFYRFIIYEKPTINNLKKTILCGLLFTGIMYAIVFPWYLRNYIWTGNPFFPFLYGIFDGRYWNPELALWLKESFHSDWGLGDYSIKAFLLLPLYLTFLTNKFGQLLGIGPFYLAFIPLILFFKKSKVIRYSLFFIFFSFVLWFFGSQQMRFIIFILPAMAILSAYVMDILLSSKSAIKRILQFLFLVYILFSFLIWCGVNWKQVPRGLGLESDKEFLAKIDTDHDYEAFEFLNDNIDRNSKILFFRKESGYYSNFDFIRGTYMQGYVYYKGYNSSEDLMKRLRQENVTHIMINLDKYGDNYLGDKKFDKQMIDLMDGVINSSRMIYSKEGTFVYEISQ